MDVRMYCPNKLYRINFTKKNKISQKYEICNLKFGHRYRSSLIPWSLEFFLHGFRADFSLNACPLCPDGPYMNFHAKSGVCSSKNGLVMA